MYELDIERDFSAAHCLKGYQGNCSALHGHNWVVQVFVKAAELDEIGIAMDFRKLKDELDKLLDRFDHCSLNELPEFENANPTSEMLAKIIFDSLAKELDDDNVKVSRVRVCESPGSGATYYRD